MNKKEVSQYMSKIAKKGHKIKPRSKAYYSDLGKKSVIVRRAKKLSTGV